MHSDWNKTINTEQACGQKAIQIQNIDEKQNLSKILANKIQDMCSKKYTFITNKEG